MCLQSYCERGIDTAFKTKYYRTIRVIKKPGDLWPYAVIEHVDAGEVHKCQYRIRTIVFCRDCMRVSSP